MNAEDRLISRIWLVEVAGTPFAFSTLAFFRNRREHSRSIKVVEFVDDEFVCDCLFQRLEDLGVDAADHGPTHVAAKRHHIAVLFCHDGPAAVDASGSVGAPAGRAERRRAPFHRSAPPKTVQHSRSHFGIVENVAHLPIELLERYALKEVSETEKHRVENHVATCPKCRYILEEQLGWAAAMRSPFNRMVEKMIEEERKKRRKAGTGGSVKSKT